MNGLNIRTDIPFAADQLAQAKVDGELSLFGGSDDTRAVYKFRESSNEFLKIGSLQTPRLDAKDINQYCFLQQ